VLKVRIPGFDRVAGLAGSIPIKKNSKQRYFSKKKAQKSTGCNRVFDLVLPGQPTRSAESHRVMIFSIFFSTRPDFSHGSARSQIDLLDRTRFQNYTHMYGLE
jgi:hypothetical protein